MTDADVSAIEAALLRSAETSGRAMSAAQARQAAQAAADFATGYCGRQFARGVYVEYLDADGGEFLQLLETPVWSVAEVRYDASGRFGQSTGSFPDSSVLVPGQDWQLQLDTPRVGLDPYSAKGRLFVGGRLPQGRSARFDLLFEGGTDNRGCYKVTYTGGYEKLPADLIDACTRMAQIAVLADGKLGPFTSESLGSYSYSVGGTGITGSMAPAPGTSEFAYYTFDRYKRTRSGVYVG